MNPTEHFRRQVDLAHGRLLAELALDGALPTLTGHDRLLPGLTKRERIERKRRSRDRVRNLKRAAR